jgi:hypothetical protein
VTPRCSKATTSSTLGQVHRGRQRGVRPRHGGRSASTLGSPPAAPVLARELSQLPHRRLPDTIPDRVRPLGLSELAQRYHAESATGRTGCCACVGVRGDGDPPPHRGGRRQFIGSWLGGFSSLPTARSGTRVGGPFADGGVGAGRPSFPPMRGRFERTVRCSGGGRVGSGRPGAQLGSSLTASERGRVSRVGCRGGRRSGPSGRRSARGRRRRRTRRRSCPCVGRVRP